MHGVQEFMGCCFDVVLILQASAFKENLRRAVLTLE